MDEGPEYFTSKPWFWCVDSAWAKRPVMDWRRPGRGEAQVACSECYLQLPLALVSWSLGLTELTSLTWQTMYHQYNPPLALAYPPVQTPLPPALQHLRNLMLYKYLESLRHQENIIIQQESPIDLSINSIKQDRDCLGSTGSHSPRSNHSLNITN